MQACLKRSCLRPLFVLAVALLLCGCHNLRGPTPGHNSGTLFREQARLGEGREWRPYPVIVDFNGDGHLDILCTHRQPLEANSLHIWFGDGSGAFQEAKQSWKSPGYSGLAVGDINRDGRLDLVAASHFNRVQTYLADSQGRLIDSNMVTPDGYNRAELRDLDGDGYLDLLAVGFQKGGVEIYKGDGTAKWNFGEQLIQGIGRDAAVADLNGDGRPDIIASLARHGVVIFYRKPDGSYEQKAAGFRSATKEFRSLTVADFNHDGRPDVALNGGYAGPGEPNGPDVYLADGEGGWTEASRGLKALGRAGEGIAVSDFDGDGELDLVVGGSLTAEIGDEAYGLFLFKGDGRGNWSLEPHSGLAAQGLMRPYGIAVGDLNQDGAADLVVAHGSTEKSDGYLTVWMGKSTPPRQSAKLKTSR
jgi:hypothetical protein